MKKANPGRPLLYDKPMNLRFNFRLKDITQRDFLNKKGGANWLRKLVAAEMAKEKAVK
jgi:hypothetical protein